VLSANSVAVENYRVVTALVNTRGIRKWVLNGGQGSTKTVSASKVQVGGMPLTLRAGGPCRSEAPGSILGAAV